MTTLNTDSDLQQEKNFLFRSLSYGLILVAIIWVVKLLELLLNIDLKYLGVFPQHLKGLPGIIFSPFIHGDLSHLMSNSMPLLLLTSMLFYFYKRLGIKILLLTWLIGNVWLWIIGRESYHIGASGIIYGLAAFLFVSGIIRKHPRLISISLLIAFLYGSMIWGIFPIKEGVSWEGHLMGMIAGFVLAIYYRNEGPQRKKYDWEFEEDEDEEEIYGGRTLTEWDEYFDEKSGKQ